MSVSLEKMNRYRSKLPLPIQDFINKISEEKFCKEVLRFPKLATSLDEYMTELYGAVNNMFKVRNNYNNLVKLTPGLKATISNFEQLINRVDVSKIFTDVGISNDNIMLLFDAAILNWVVSEIDIKQDIVIKIINEIHSSNEYFPYDVVMMLLQDVNAMNYGEYGTHKFNILVAWLYVYYLSSTCDECFGDFVKLIFEKDDKVVTR
ncbi:MAG: hypothetical protein ACTJLM_02085 [Ehrlichia sp.]